MRSATHLRKGSVVVLHSDPGTPLIVDGRFHHEYYRHVTLDGLDRVRPRPKLHPDRWVYVCRRPDGSTAWYERRELRRPE